MQEEKNPKTILGATIHWSKSRPVWQQDALRRIICTGALTEHDFDSLAELAKKAHGAAGPEVEAEPLAEKHIPHANERTVGSVGIRGVHRIVYLYDLEDEDGKNPQGNLYAGVPG